MAVSVLAKKVKVSKNRKTYWRKHVNLKDVEEFLEEKRQDERFGGAAADKPDDQLFVVENKRTGKSNAYAKGQPPVLLRCFQNLQPDSAVPPPIKPHQLQGVQGKVKVQPSWAKDKRQKTKTSVHTLRKKRSTRNTLFDLWSVKPDNSEERRAAAAVAAGVDADFLPDAVTRKTVKVPEYRYQKPSLLAAVEIPHPGASYNPTYEDHQALLMSAHEVEAKRQKEEDYLDRSLTSKFPKQLPTQEAWLEEMSAGLFDEEKEEEEEEEKNEGQTKSKSWGQPVSFHNRKTKAERHQEKAKMAEKRKLLTDKVKKRRLNDLNSVKALKKQIVKAENVSAERVKKRERYGAEAMYRPRRLGPCKYTAPDLEIQLPQELSDNLTTLKMEGHLMEDRFKSLQRRNLIEPRQRQKVPKKNVKVLLRRTHRD